MKVESLRQGCPVLATLSPVHVNSQSHLLQPVIFKAPHDLEWSYLWHPLFPAVLPSQAEETFLSSISVIMSAGINIAEGRGDAVFIDKWRCLKSLFADLICTLTLNFSLISIFLENSSADSGLKKMYQDSFKMYILSYSGSPWTARWVAYELNKQIKIFYGKMQLQLF